MNMCMLVCMSVHGRVWREGERQRKREWMSRFIQACSGEDSKEGKHYGSIEYSIKYQIKILIIKKITH